MYAMDHREMLPSGLSDNPDPTDSHIHVLSTKAREDLVQYSGSRKMLECPSLGEPFNSEGGWFYAGYGYVIGYNYLGGHDNTPWPDYNGFRGFSLRNTPNRIRNCPSLPTSTTGRRV